MNNKIMTIIPCENGYVVMPFDLNLMVPMNNPSGKMSVSVSSDVAGLLNIIKQIYQEDPIPLYPEDPSSTKSQQGTEG